MTIKGLVHGVGINDADYVLQKYAKAQGKERGKLVWICPFYKRWKSVLQRCYSSKIHNKYPTYKDCTVCEEWLTFSNFKSWMEKQEWVGMHLDKDLLMEGNKVYSPETCVFVPRVINMFTVGSNASSDNYLLGCSWDGGSDSFKARVSNPFTCKTEHIGRFDTELEAHFAWKKRKHEYSCLLADSEYVTDEKVKEILLNRYKNFSTVEYHLR